MSEEFREDSYLAGLMADMLAQRVQRQTPPPDDYADYGDDVDAINLRVDTAWDMAPVPYRSLTVRTSHYRCSMRQSVDPDQATGARAWNVSAETLAQKLATASVSEINSEIPSAIEH